MVTVVGCAAAAVMLLAGTGAAHQGDGSNESPDYRKQTMLSMSTTSVSLLPTPSVMFRTKLTEAHTGKPIVGRRIDFYGGGYAICQASTDRQGWARSTGRRTMAPRPSRRSPRGMRPCSPATVSMPPPLSTPRPPSAPTHRSRPNPLRLRAGQRPVRVPPSRAGLCPGGRNPYREGTS
ncbi:hypothetical protein GCM10010365_70830 [Streptomyces poonensis]|uniref:Uncharacterized protein n=1 Tax=Streptomyces poonensis TaxID=68255 RepID=A0A918QCI8_9ACTN|nr:hypothetical protein GCM10010365_70830 [Streptomyces poonensis]GLJ92901.1 hypothetical protein GCM10017589_55120 [Streptomyces poonensis]